MKRIVIAIFSPLFEKNPAKALAARTPFVLSMSRLIVLAFGIGMVRQMWKAGIAGWPEAVLAIAIVLALPLLAAFERLGPEHVIDVWKSLLGRAGTGAVRTAGALYSREPSKYDDHWDDGSDIAPSSRSRR